MTDEHGPKPAVEVSTSKNDRWGRMAFDVRVPEEMLQKKGVGNVQVARWLADNLQGWLENDYKDLIRKLRDEEPEYSLRRSDLLLAAEIIEGKK